ncbi:MAG: CBS domain-containing protein [Balneolales bacterium]
MKVQQILLKKGNQVISVNEETTVYEAIALMADHNIGALIVMDNEHMSGIVSERDYRNKVILKGRRSKDTPVKDIMTQNVFCVGLDYDLNECMKIISDKKIRHLPVLDARGQLAGIISIGDIVRSIMDEQKSEIQNLRNYISSGYPA